MIKGSKFVETVIRSTKRKRILHGSVLGIQVSILRMLINGGAAANLEKIRWGVRLQNTLKKMMKKEIISLIS